MRAAVEWSQQLLDPGEQEAFRSLAVFVGGFDADAAAAVAPGLSLDVLARLVDKSLVAVVETPRGRTRYRLLETVREYACELLVEAGEPDAARERHLRHFSALAEVAREEWLSTGAQRFVNELDDDYENVRAALEWAAATDPCAAMRLLAGTRDLFFRFGQADGLRLARLLLERCPARDRHRGGGADRGRAAGGLDRGLRSGRRGAGRGARAEHRARRAGARGLGPLLPAAWPTRSPARSRPAASSSRRAARCTIALGIRIGEARSIAVLGMTFLMADDAAAAKELLEAALAIYVDERGPLGPGPVPHVPRLIAESAADPASATVALPRGRRAACARPATRRCCPSR